MFVKLVAEFIGTFWLLYRVLLQHDITEPFGHGPTRGGGARGGEGQVARHLTMEPWSNRQAQGALLV